VKPVPPGPAPWPGSLRGMKALPGASASAALTVSPADTAPALASGDLPVLATPRLLALIHELAHANS